MLRREQSKFGDLRFVFLYRRFRFCACKKRSGFPLPIARSLMIPTAFSPDILPDGSHSSVPEIVTDKNYHVHTESFPKPQMDSSPCFFAQKTEDHVVFRLLYSLDRSTEISWTSSRFSPSQQPFRRVSVPKKARPFSVIYYPLIRWVYRYYSTK
jgi:hypothetical protein